MIEIAATAQQSARPITHDIVHALLQQFGLTLERAEITEVREDIFHAHLGVSDGAKRSVIDCRPADAIALALREGAQLFVSDHVLKQQGVPELV